MKIAERLRTSSLLSLGIALLGLITFTLIIQQPQSYRSSAKRPRPKPTEIPFPEPTPTPECACVSWLCTNSQLTLTTPNGGEVWERDNTYDIVWEQPQALEGSSTSLFIYTRDSTGDHYIGPIEYYVSNNVGTNTYSWSIPQLGLPNTIPPLDGDNIIIEVKQFDSNGDAMASDKSDSTFTVITPQPVLTLPNGGEVWGRGNTYEITWEQSFTSFATSLFIYTRDSTGDHYIGPIEYYVSNNVGTNSYAWTIPPLGSPLTTPPDGDNIIVGVAQYDSSGQEITGDKSDSTFTVVTP